MSTAWLLRPFARLEALAPARPAPLCIPIVGMAPPGREWIREVLSLADGSRLRRDAGEARSAFDVRVRYAAVAMLAYRARGAIAVAVDGRECRDDAEPNR